MTLHYPKVSDEQRRAEDADRLRKIRAGRIAENSKTLRIFRMRGLVPAWEAVSGKLMPAPDLEMEPSRFIDWLMLDPSDFEHSCQLETRYRVVLMKQRDFERRRSIAYRLCQSRRATRRRQAKMLLAIPRWSDRQAIRAIYAECRAMNETAGFVRYHVDHYYPIQGKLVSGLHVPSNLRIIEALENLKKKNAMPIDG